MGENKLIVRRLIAGILLVLLAILVMSEALKMANVGSLLGAHYRRAITTAASSGMVLSIFAGITGVIYSATCKIRPNKIIEYLIVIVDIIIIFFVSTNQYDSYFKDLTIFQVAFVILMAIGAPYKKGYKDMPFKKLNDKTSNSPDTSTVSNSSDTNSTSNSPDISTVPNSSNTNSTSNSADTSTASNSSDVILIKKRLNELKELLDDGTITQAEYDAKRKKILGI